MSLHDIKRETMTARGSTLARLVRRCSNGKLFDTVEGRAVSLDFVADLVWLGEPVYIFEERTRTDRTEAVLAPVLLSRLLAHAASARSTVESVPLARATIALFDLRAELARMNDRLAELERLLSAAIGSAAEAAPASGERGGACVGVSSTGAKRAVPGSAK